MGFFDTIPANDPNNRAIRPISAGQAKIRIGPISGTKVPYPLPRRFPHVVPNPISHMDGAVPDTNQYTSGVPLVNDGKTLNRQWRFLSKYSFISNPKTNTVPATQLATVITAPGISLAMGINQAIKIRRYVAGVADNTAAYNVNVYGRGIEIQFTGGTDQQGNSLNGIAISFNTDMIYVASPTPTNPNSGVLPAVAGMSDAMTLCDDWYEFDDYKEQGSLNNQGIWQVGLKVQGRWHLRSNTAAANTVTTRDHILVEYYELVT